MTAATPPHRATGPASCRVARVLAGLLAVAAACSPPPAPSAPIPGRSERGSAATVVAVVDGDTVELEFPGGQAERARLLGVDTPETVHPDRPVECFGPEASARAHQLLPDGTEVLVQRDREARDRYGRLLVYLWRRTDGLFVNEALVAEGYARTLSIAPNVAHRVDLSAAAARATRERAGLWGSCGDQPTGGPGG